MTEIRGIGWIEHPNLRERLWIALWNWSTRGNK